MKKDMQDLTGFEMIEVKKILGSSIEQADGIEATYAIAYIFKKREDSKVTHNDVLGMSVRQIQEYMGIEEEDAVEMPFESEDPKAS